MYKMTIITQEEDFVNYNAIKRISSFTVDISESEDEEKNVYILLAFENNSSVTTDDIEENANAIDGVIHLGVYGNREELDSVIASLTEALKRNEPVFVMPQPTK